MVKHKIKHLFLCFFLDRQYTVSLNITNEDYREGLRDHESLEFLNFAEALRSAVSQQLFDAISLRLVHLPSI